VRSAAGAEEGCFSASETRRPYITTVRSAAGAEESVKNERTERLANFFAATCLVANVEKNRGYL